MECSSKSFTSIHLRYPHTFYSNIYRDNYLKPHLDQIHKFTSTSKLRTLMLTHADKIIVKVDPVRLPKSHLEQRKCCMRHIDHILDELLRKRRLKEMFNGISRQTATRSYTNAFDCPSLTTYETASRTAKITPTTSSTPSILQHICTRINLLS